MVSSPKMNSYLVGYYGVPWFYLPPTLKNNDKFKKWLDDAVFCNYLNDCTNKRISSFKWKNLPESCDSWTMELLLLYYGNIGMYRDELTGDFLCLGLVPYGEDGVNANGRPVNGWLYRLDGKTQKVKLFFNGIDKPITRETSTRKFVNATYNCVRGQENALGIPFIQNILVRCHQLALRENILDATIENCRQPLIITCDERDYKTVKKEIEDIQDNRTKIICYNGAFSKDSLNVLDTRVNPQILDSVKNELVRLQNEVDKMLGINSTPFEKKERLLVDEVNSNNQSTNANVEVALEWRRRFCEDCNKAFGLKMDVEYNYYNIGENSNDEGGFLNESGEVSRLEEEES